MCWGIRCVRLHMAQTVVIDALDELPLLSPLDILSHLNDRRARRLRSDEWSSRLLQRVDDPLSQRRGSWRLKTEVRAALGLKGSE